MSAREQVLANVRRALKRREPLGEGVTAVLEARMADPPIGVQPHYAGGPVDRFIAKIEAVHGIVTRVEAMAEVGPAVEAHVERFALPFELVVAPDPALDAVPWSNRFKVERRAALEPDRVSVTVGFAGVGETGTVVLLSSPLNPTTLNFLPEDHIIVLHERRIVRYLEDVWPLLRADDDALPRTVNMITGPSKTGDVDQVLQEGAHGPRRIHVVLVAD